jgi:hypothetical protein
MVAKRIRRRTGVLATAILGGLVAGLLAAGLVVAFGNDDKNVRPLDPSEVPTPIASRWIRPDTGEFWNGDGSWDNRSLSDEQKAAKPWYDPRWKPFSDCMVERGFDVRASSSEAFAQKDLDELIRRLNIAMPDGQANKQLGPAGPAPGIAGAFLACADRWLTIAPDDYEKNGIRMLEPGEIPEP